MKISRKSVLLTSAISAMLLTSAPVVAQDADDGAANNEDVITVTARRREESILKVPVVASVMSAEELTQTGTVKARHEAGVVEVFERGVEEQLGGGAGCDAAGGEDAVEERRRGGAVAGTGAHAPHFGEAAGGWMGVRDHLDRVGGGGGGGRALSRASLHCTPPAAVPRAWRAPPMMERTRCVVGR